MKRIISTHHGQPGAPGTGEGDAAAIERLLAFLRDPRSYPDRPRRIQLLQTHASYLVLTARRACKVKKPVELRLP